MVAVEQRIVQVIVSLPNTHAEVVGGVSAVGTFKPRGPAVAVVVCVLVIVCAISIRVVVGPISVAIDVFCGVGDVVEIAISVVIDAVSPSHCGQGVGLCNWNFRLQFTGHVGHEFNKHRRLAGEEEYEGDGQGTGYFPMHGIAPLYHVIK